MNAAHSLRAIAFCALATSASHAQAPIDLRVAIVIGNAAYAAAPLLNPANDAKAMGEALKGMGFRIVEVRDGSRAQMQAAIAQMSEQLNGRNGVGMLYYAGHGLQLDWRNYMVPVDAKLQSAADIPAQTVDVQAVLDAFKAAGSRMNIVVLDACRDNPFAATASGKGLAPMDAPPGTLLAYATAPGNMAEDGSAGSGNGLYTQYLVQEIKTPGARIEDVFKRVRFSVRQQSSGRQIPWESTSLEDDFSFDTGIKAFAKPDRRTREKTFNTEKADWDRIASSKNVADFYDFLKKYPSGDIAELAQSRIGKLQAPAVVAQPERDGVASDTVANRFHEGDRYEFIIKDGLTGVVKGPATATIRLIGDDMVEGVATGMSGFTGTRDGFASRDANGTYDPPFATVPGSAYEVGKKWSTRTIQTRPNGDKQWIDINTVIAARETVSVPAGTFDTYRIEISMLLQSGVRVTLTFWDDPAWGYAPKFKYERRDRWGAPDITIREMTSRSRGS